MAVETTPRREEVYILYGSQSGSTEKAALAFAEEMTKKLTSESIEEMTGTQTNIEIMPTVMKLDEFLERKEGKWTRLVLLFLSSYGSGEAPVGAKKFRDFCDALVKQYENNNHQIKTNLPLEGLHYSMCSFGQFSFKTYFVNTSITERGLRAAGAKRIGEVAKADAKGVGEHSQANVVKRWKEEMWKPLADFFVQEPLSEESLKNLHERTAAIQY